MLRRTQCTPVQQRAQHAATHCKKMAKEMLFLQHSPCLARPNKKHRNNCLLGPNNAKNKKLERTSWWRFWSHIWWDGNDPFGLRMRGECRGRGFFCLQVACNVVEDCGANFLKSCLVCTSVRKAALYRWLQWTKHRRCCLQEEGPNYLTMSERAVGPRYSTFLYSFCVSSGGSNGQKKAKSYTWKKWHGYMILNYVFVKESGQTNSTRSRYSPFLVPNA